MKCLSTLQRRSERTDDSDLESIENPRDPKPNDDEKVKTAPGQPVEPERDIGVNNRWGEDRLLSLWRSIVGAVTELNDAEERR